MLQKKEKKKWAHMSMYNFHSSREKKIQSGPA
jgi:hypothetical protein